MSILEFIRRKTLYVYNSIRTVAVSLPKLRSEKYIHLNYENTRERMKLIFFWILHAELPSFSSKTSKPRTGMSGLSCEIPVVIQVQEQLQQERYGTQRPFCHVCQIQTRGPPSIPNILDKWLTQKTTALVSAAVSLKPETQIPSS